VTINLKPITNVETRDSVAALTFDDGPHPEYTPIVLNILKKHRVSATFFMVGKLARQHPQIVYQVAAAGHAIGIHSWNHVNLTEIKSRFRRLKQLWTCSRALAPYSGRLFRPPYGAQDSKIRFDAFLLNYKIILWSASAQDWIPQEPDQIAQKMIRRIKPGTIFLLHDCIYRRHEAATDGAIAWDREPMFLGMTKALALLIEKIRFVTVPELLQAGRPVSRWPIPMDKSC
jgi:peptidoglycan/xylan/chitin deacetylase (PgdA/CDA1 family)